jgi:predicted Zn finger-like uncharacterized protein
MAVRTTCNACGETYEVDESKYGGKKIRCKKCGSAISVPSSTADQFEVLEENAELRPKAPSDSTRLNRNRIAGSRAAVSVTLLKRAESSREEIRMAVYAAYGDETARSRRIAALRSRITEIHEDGKQEEGLIELFGPYAAVQSSREDLSESTGGEHLFVAMAGSIIGRFQSIDVKLDEVFSKAVLVLGAPVRPLPPGTDIASQTVGACANVLLTIYGRGVVWGKEGLKAGNDAIAEALSIKRDTIRAAHSLLLRKKHSRPESIARTEEEIASTIREMCDSTDEAIATAYQLIADRSWDEASNIAKTLLTTCPVERLGDVLVLLSRVAFSTTHFPEAARRIQEAICCHAVAPTNTDAAYVDLWCKAEAGLPPL